MFHPLHTVRALPPLTAVFALAASLSACAGPGPTDAASLADAPVQEGCGSTHALVGATGVLSERFHDVKGTVTVVDDCTLRVDGFSYDGGGLDVRFYGAPDGDFAAGTAITANLLGQSYDGDTLTIALPEGVTLDDVKQLSVWCVVAREDFGSTTLTL